MNNDQENQGNPGEQGNEQQSQGRSAESIAAEMHRKTDKLAQENAKLSQQLERVMEMLNKQPVAQSAQGEDDLEALVYKDPKAYARKIREQAAQDAQQVVNRSLQQQSQTNAVLSQLTSEYPELADGSSELTKATIEIYKGMSADERSSPSAYKIAVRDAAAELGVLPKNKRRVQNNEDFSLSGNNGASQKQASRSAQSEVDPKTEAFAKLLGLDTTNKDTMKRLQNRSQRKNWTKWE